jgi:hypothetical protein
MTCNALTILVVLICTTSFISCSTAWQVTLKNGRVISNVDGERLNGESLIVSDDIGSHSIPADSITRVRLVRDASFWKGAKTGALIGGATGVVVGAVAGANAKPSSETGVDKTALRIVTVPLGAIVYGAMFGVVGGTIGGPVGALSGHEEEYDLSSMPLRDKLNTIQSVLSKNKK